MLRVADLLSRLLYGGVLSRLPESIAVPLGQWGLRCLPLDRLSIFRHDDPRLAITLGGVRLPNPLILSSMYYDTAILRRAMGLGFGAVTAKSITPYPRPGHPAPNLVRIQTPEGPGLVNCHGFHNPGLAAYRLDIARVPHRVPLIVAAAGESAEDYVAVVEGLAPFGDLVEINISSPNTKLVYGWSERPAQLAALVRARAQATGKPNYREGAPGLRVGKGGGAHPRRARRGHHHREQRQHASHRRAAPLAEDGRSLRPRPLYGDAHQRAAPPSALRGQ